MLHICDMHAMYELMDCDRQTHELLSSSNIMLSTGSHCCRMQQNTMKMRGSMTSSPQLLVTSLLSTT